MVKSRPGMKALNELKLRLLWAYDASACLHSSLLCMAACDPVQRTPCPRRRELRCSVGGRGRLDLPGKAALGSPLGRRRGRHMGERGDST